MQRGAVAIGCFWLLISLAAACAGERDDVVLVMAAASLTDAFVEIEAAFEQVHPDLDVQLNFAGSSSLREQILEGAPADVFASANAATMQAVVDAGQTRGDPAVFASNTLRIAVPAGNPAGVRSLSDLANEDLLVGLCAEGVPCGDFARVAVAHAGATVSADTNELDVRALVTKIEAGELDAGIVYATDIAASPLVEGIDLPASAAVDISYPVVELLDAPNASGAARFMEFVLSAPGQAILAEHEFGAP